MRPATLEAIDRWSYRESLDAVSPPGYAQADVHQLIPIAKRANFNDSIAIEAGVGLDEHDQLAIREAAQKQGIRISDSIGPFAITQRYKFTASRIDDGQPKSMWALHVKGRVSGAKRPRVLAGDEWQQVVNVIKPILPRIVYFPNFRSTRASCRMSWMLLGTARISKSTCSPGQKAPSITTSAP